MSKQNNAITLWIKVTENIIWFNNKKHNVTVIRKIKCIEYIYNKVSGQIIVFKYYTKKKTLINICFVQ